MDKVFINHSIKQAYQMIRIRPSTGKNHFHYKSDLTTEYSCLQLSRNFQTQFFLWPQGLYRVIIHRINRIKSGKERAKE